MKAEIAPGQVMITLSERNLLALLHKLAMPGSRRELQTRRATVEGTPTDLILIRVRCEPDRDHYAYRDAPPGPMHPDTEAFIHATRRTT